MDTAKNISYSNHGNQVWEGDWHNVYIVWHKLKYMYFTVYVHISSGECIMGF